MEELTARLRATLRRLQYLSASAEMESAVFTNGGLTIDFENDVPALFTGDPRAIVEAIEGGTFDHGAFQAFVRHNIALPSRGTCTEQLCGRILALAEKPAN
mgnify:CR=1 FL=1